MTTGTTLRIWPISPFRNASEPKMHVVVANDAKTLGRTWRAPSTAASSGDFPCDRLVAIFSAMTMASSMSRPITINNPTMVSMLIV